jgi:hypothetical protein
MRFGFVSGFPLCHAASRSSLLPVVTPETPRLPGEAFSVGLAQLQIADSAAYLLILGIAGGIPECPGLPVVEGHQGGYATGTAAAQVLLAGPRQRDPDALSAMPVADGQPIQIPSPAVPAGNQSANDLIVALGNQKGSWGADGDQALDVIRPVRRACVLTPPLGP